MTDRIETTEPEAAAGVAGQSGVSCSVSRLKVLDLFSGIGGFSLGLERAGMKTVAFCEIETFPRKVLQKHWPDVPVFEDVRKLHAEDLPKPVDVICGGFPCQPFSVCGKKLGKQDDRYLWPEMLRIISECRPTWVIGENVSGAISILREIKDGLATVGFESAIFDIPTSALGFPHHRRRMWIVAHAYGDRLEELPERCGETESVYNEASGASTAFRAAQRLHGRGDCNVIRRGDGISRRLVKPRMKALGNAVCPAIPEIIGRAILAQTSTGTERLHKVLLVAGVKRGRCRLAAQQK